MLLTLPMMNSPQEAPQHLRHDADVHVQVDDGDRRESGQDQETTDTSSSRRSRASLLGNVRVNGFERPWGRDQALSCLGHTISAVCFYVAAISLLLDTHTRHHNDVRVLTTIIMAFHTPAIVVLVAAWVSCERIDPSKSVEEVLPNGWFGIKLGGPRWAKTRYCAVCRKSVPGLDHHCTWLQTCIGVSNYAQFFAIACTGAVQFVTQAVFGALCLLWLRLPLTYEGKPPSVVEVMLLVSLAISVPCVIMYTVLLSFHVSLYFLGYGTYEWMLRRRKRQKQARARSKRSDKAQAHRARSTGDLETSTVLRDADGRRIGTRASSAPHRDMLAASASSSATAL